ncbi:hypothetical protein BH11MYX2_BH11MYX2_02140 [soil metagenome]
MGRPQFTIELAADAGFSRDLAAGGVFVPARALNVFDELDLTVKGHAGEMCVVARVVYIDPAKGAGLELIGFGPAMKKQLAALAGTASEKAAFVPTANKATIASGSMPAMRTPAGSMPAMKTPEIEAQPGGSTSDSDAGVRFIPPDPEAAIRIAKPSMTAGPDAVTADPDAEDDSAEGVERKKLALNAQERLRGLTLAEQIKVARGPSSGERIALERMYGKNVWEALLRNPGLTAPEVSRMARLGTLPRILLDVIVGNNTWMQVPETRRALLANPRLGTDQVMRVLRFLPKHELKLAATIPAYPQSVRSLAKRMAEE